MGSALIRGLVNSGKTSGDSIDVFDVDHGATQALHEDFRVVQAERAEDTITPETGMLVLAVKPQIIGDALDRVRDKISDRPVVVSIAAGVSTGFILSHLNSAARVIRVMPNAAAMVGQSASALCKAGGADEEDLEQALEIFRSIGAAVTVDEKMMNVATALSGSGPGYLFAIMEAMTDAAVRMGMDRPTARDLTVRTVQGAAAMAATENTSFSELKDRITSPGGTTIAGLHVLERAGLRGIIMDVIEAATRRGEELGSG